MMHEIQKTNGKKFLIPVLGAHVDDQNKKYREIFDEKTYTEFKLTDVNQDKILENDHTYGIHIKKLYLATQTDKLYKISQNQTQNENYISHNTSSPEKEEEKEKADDNDGFYNSLKESDFNVLRHVNFNIIPSLILFRKCSSQRSTLRCTVIRLRKLQRVKKRISYFCEAL